MTASDPKTILNEFCIICERAWIEHALYASLYESDRRTMELCRSIAPMFFHDINQIIIEHLLLQFSRITDPARTRNDANLTTNFVLEEIDWPEHVHKELFQVNERLMAFRRYVIGARSKRVAHVDLVAQVEQSQALGTFPEGADRQFLLDLQRFIDIAYGHLNNGQPRPIDVGMATDTHDLIKALEKATAYDRCPKCTEFERVDTLLGLRRHR